MTVIGSASKLQVRDDGEVLEPHRLGARLELRAENPAAEMSTVLDAVLTEIRHPRHPYHFRVPGDQVLTIAPGQPNPAPGSAGNTALPSEARGPAPPCSNARFVGPT